jgi:DNA polymerase-3 subunit beta
MMVMHDVSAHREGLKAEGDGVDGGLDAHAPSTPWKSTPSRANASSVNTENGEKHPMKTTIERGALLRTLAHAQSVVERRNTIPILSNVLLDASGDSLMVMATDLDLEVNEPVAARVDQPGRITVPAHTFFDILRKVPDGDVSLSAEGGRMAIVAGRARFSLPTLPAEEFPHISVGDMPINFSVPAKTLSSMIDATRSAMSTEETRYYLQGIYLHARRTDDGEWRLAATSTDGHRLSLSTAISPQGTEGMQDDKGVIVPRKCVLEINKIVDQIDGDVEISMSKTKIRFTMGRMTYVSKLVDGTFPDYDRVIPRNNESIVKVDADALAESIDRVSTIATEKTRAVKVAIDRNRLTLSVNSPENGLATEEIEVDYEGKPLEIGFNSRYFLDVLSLLRGAQIELAINDAAAPVVIRRQGEKEDLAVLMPMRV